MQEAINLISEIETDVSLVSKITKSFYTASDITTNFNFISKINKELIIDKNFNLVGTNG